MREPTQASTPWTFNTVNDSLRNKTAKLLLVDAPLGGFVRFELRTVATKDHTPKLHGSTFIGTINEKVNADFIVRAVNSHTELLQTCKALVAAEDASKDKFEAEEIDRIEAAMQTARAAIARAEGRAQ